MSDKMIDLENLNSEIIKNQRKYKNVIQNFAKDLETNKAYRTFRKERVRSRHHDEKKILDSFKRQ